VLLVRYLIIGFVLGLTTNTILSQDNINELNNEQKLKANNFQLKLQLSQCQLTVAQFQLGKEQSELLMEFKKTLNGKDGEEFDWVNLRFQEKDASK